MSVVGLRVIDIIEAAGDPQPREEFLRQVRLLECVREVIEAEHGLTYWAMVYRAADRRRRDKALNLQNGNGEQSWES